MRKIIISFIRFEWTVITKTWVPYHTKMLRVGRSIGALMHCQWYTFWRYTDRYMCLWMMICEALYFLIFKNIDCQKLVLFTKNQSTKMADNINRRKASQSVFLYSLNLPAGISMKFNVKLLWYSFCLVLVKKKKKKKNNWVILYCSV